MILTSNAATRCVDGRFHIEDPVNSVRLIVPATDYADMATVMVEFSEANDWQIVDAAQPAHSSPPPLCYSSVWLSMNVLVLDHNTVVVEHPSLAEYRYVHLNKLGAGGIRSTS